MEIEKHKQLIEELRTDITETRRTEVLLNLLSDYTNVSAQITKLESDKKELENRCNEYANLNTQLFAKVTASTNNDSQEDHKQEEQQQEEPKKMKYSDLTFD